MAKSTNKYYRRQGRSQERFRRLAGWLGPWEGVKESDKIAVRIGQGLAEAYLADENNYLQVERQVTL